MPLYIIYPNNIWLSIDWYKSGKLIFRCTFFYLSDGKTFIIDHKESLLLMEKADKFSNSALYLSKALGVNH
jgi:hypothetical protein